MFDLGKLQSWLMEKNEQVSRISYYKQLPLNISLVSPIADKFLFKRGGPAVGPNDTTSHEMAYTGSCFVLPNAILGSGAAFPSS